jgi:hypothetical protein
MGKNRYAKPQNLQDLGPYRVSYVGVVYLVQTSRQAPQTIKLKRFTDFPRASVPDGTYIRARRGPIMELVQKMSGSSGVRACNSRSLHLCPRRIFL